MCDGCEGLVASDYWLLTPPLLWLWLGLMQVL